MEGFIKLHRKLVAWGWYQNYVVKDLFIHLLLNANFRTSTWQGQVLEAGQLVTGLKQLSADLGFSIQQIRTALNKLKSTGEITIKSTNKYSIITVVNWADYQSGEDFVTSKLTSKSTNEQQTNNKQITNNQQQKKNIKNVKNEKNDKNIVEIVCYLNEKAGKHFKHNTDSTRRHINARLNEGYSFEDFKTVIDYKCSEWLHTDMEKYLRPETLFGTKFESYLNSAPRKVTPEFERGVDYF